MTKRLTIALVALAMFVLVAIMPASASFNYINTSINQGASVFIGEQGLNLTPAVTTWNAAMAASGGAYTGKTATALGWWASAANIGSTTATATYPLTADGITTISSSAFGMGAGSAWYVIDPVTGFANSSMYINVKDPQLSVDIWDLDQGTQGGIAVSGGSVIQGDHLTFKIGTNMDAAINQPLLRQNQTALVTGYTPVDQQGWAEIKVKTDSGNTLTSLLNDAKVPLSITSQKVNAPSWYWSTPALGNWSTGVLGSTGANAYPAGTYTVTVESKMNNMLNNYLNGGASYTTKTVSSAQTVTIASNTVSLSANKDSVVRSKAFSVTITGRANTVYHLWVKGTSTMSGAYDDQPPMIAPYQAGVTLDNEANVGLLGAAGIVPSFAAGENGNYQYQNGAQATILSDVAPNTKNWSPAAAWAPLTKAQIQSMQLGNGTYEYANVLLSDSGTRTVQFLTTNWTKAQQYTIRVEQNFTGQFKSDEVNVQVAKGAVTIVAAGDQSYYLGEEIQFSGTNTETQTTWLFITGPNLGAYGSSMTSLDPRSRDLSDTAATPAINDGDWIQASVLADNTWSYKWGTSTVALDQGTYTIFATSQKSTSLNTQLANVAYGTCSIIIKAPFISATASQSTVAQGDSVFITGTAQGQPSAGVQIWILGKNYAVVKSQSVNSDASFSYEVKKEDTKSLSAGQYFVVAQHPMQNNKFDIQYEPNAYGPAPQVAGYVWNELITTTPLQLFKLTGSSSLQGSNAAQALIDGINSANVDDTYTKLQFLVEVPVINVDPVGDRHVGDKFTVTGTTNLAVDDDVLMEIYSSSFKPTDKSMSSGFSGSTGTVKVTKGDSGLNKISFDVDASTYKPDEYIVKATAVLQEASGTALFNVLEGTAPTAVPTTVTTTAPVTVVTTVPTTVATPTQTPTQPGFGALIALIGLGAVALLVVRRH
ncbi:MAG: MEMAR_RS02690 family S-layer glycoprotein [Methanoregula sp.]